MNKSRFPVRTPFRFRKDYGKIKTTCKLCAETACREVERRDGIGGCPDRGAVLGAGRGGHCGEQRQVRRLLLPDRLPHPGPAGGRGGVRGRHLAAGLGGHAAQPPRQAGYVPGEDHPEPVPGPLAGGAGPPRSNTSLQGIVLYSSVCPIPPACAYNRAYFACPATYNTEEEGRGRGLPPAGRESGENRC